MTDEEMKLAVRSLVRIVCELEPEIRHQLQHRFHDDPVFDALRQINEINEDVCERTRKEYDACQKIPW